MQWESTIADFYVAGVEHETHGSIPVGLIISRNGGEHPVLHAVWFKWASPRQIIESSCKFLCLLRDDGIVGFVQFDTENSQYDNYFDRLCDLKVLRRVGMIHHLHGRGQHVRLYQTMRKLQ